MSALYLAAWLVAAAPGIAAVLALSAAGTRGRLAAGAGQGVVLGLLATAAVTAIVARGDTVHAWLHAAPWLTAVTVVAALFAVRRRHAEANRQHPAAKVEYWKMALVALALATLAWRGWLLGSEVSMRPTYPWDAWDAWAVKSKTWFLIGHYAAFVAPLEWLRSNAELFSGPAWAYPSTLGWMQVYFASAAGGWTEPLVNLPWFALWIGMLLGHFGQWRALGVPWPRAALLVYALGSLPLLDSHVALAGYADLWIATLFGFAVLAWLRWQERRERGQLVLALLCAAILPTIKLEGMVWCVSLVAAIGLGALPARWRWRTAAVALVLAVLLVVIGQAQLLFAAIGWVRGGSRVIDIPVIGRLAIAWHGEAALGLARGLFTQSNWHLLWWLLPPLLVWRRDVLLRSEPLRLLGLLLLACLALLLFLFVFTEAAEWAESYTAVNRLILHLAPAAVSLAALLLRTPRPLAAAADTDRAFAPQRDPA